MCLLEPFAQYTSLTSGDEYTTFSTVVPVLMELDYHLKAMKEKPGLREIASLLQKELFDQFQKVLVPTSFNFDPIFVVATALDPRYRVLLHEEQLRHAKVYIMQELSGIKEGENVLVLLMLKKVRRKIQSLSLPLNDFVIFPVS